MYLFGDGVSADIVVGAASVTRSSCCVGSRRGFRIGGELSEGGEVFVAARRLNGDVRLVEIGRLSIVDVTFTDHIGDVGLDGILLRSSARGLRLLVVGRGALVVEFRGRELRGGRFLRHGDAVVETL